MAVLKLSDGTRVPSVTSIISNLSKPALYHWNNKQGLAGIDTSVTLREEAKTGTLLHCMVEAYLETGTEYLIEENVYKPEQIQRATHAFNIFKEWAKSHQFEDIKTELTLVSEKEQYGGTIDIYCKCDGKWTLIDLKTSGCVYKDQLLQVTAYKNLLCENEHPVESVMVVSVDKYEDIPAAVEEMTDGDTYLKMFLALRDIYKYKKELNWD